MFVMEPEIDDRVGGKANEIKPAVGVEAGTAGVVREVANEAIHGEDGDSRSESRDLTMAGTSGAGRDDEQARENNADHVVDITNCGFAEDLREETICRICHLSIEPSSGSSESIQLGCNCRADLGISHRQCAETWFKQRGNRICEICGAMAKNVKVAKNNSRILIMDFDEMRPIATAPYSSPGEGSDRCKRSCCNFLLACLVLGLVVPWFFRVY